MWSFDISTTERRYIPATLTTEQPHASPCSTSVACKGRMRRTATLGKGLDLMTVSEAAMIFKQSLWLCSRFTKSHEGDFLSILLGSDSNYQTVTQNHNDNDKTHSTAAVDTSKRKYNPACLHVSRNLLYSTLLSMCTCDLKHLEKIDILTL